MPRQPRFLPPDNYYHITARGNNRTLLFSCTEDYQYYLKKFEEFKEEHPFDLYHYCLMPNHIHLLIKTNQNSNFSQFMKRLNLAYYHYFHRNYGFVGYFWQGRFKNQFISNDSYFIQCGKYIELNPVRADLVLNPEDYYWSSYCFYSNSSADSLLTPDIFYNELGQTKGERMKNYQEIIIDEFIASGLHNKKELVVGSEDFVSRTKRKFDYYIKSKKVY